MVRLVHGDREVAAPLLRRVQCRLGLLLPGHDGPGVPCAAVGGVVVEHPTLVVVWLSSLDTTPGGGGRGTARPLSPRPSSPCPRVEEFDSWLLASVLQCVEEEEFIWADQAPDKAGLDSLSSLE